MKTIMLSVSIVLCASMFTSCRSDYERAYEAESMYRLAKDGYLEKSDTTEYKEEFERIYRRMPEGVKENYKLYREEQKRIEQEVNDAYLQTSREVTSMLND